MLEYNRKQKKEEEQMNSKGKNLKNEEKTWNSTWKYSKVVLRIFICMIFSILFIFGGNVKADTII